MYPEKLKIGDEVRVIAPSRSLAIISEATRKIATDRFAEMGLKLTFGQHVEESDEFLSSSVSSRLDDLHNAFLDKNVKAVITAIGGFNANQLLSLINWQIVKNNPKIFCGFSDITVLNNAIYSQTGLVNYYGPHYSSFGQQQFFDYTLDYFKKCLFLEDNFNIEASEKWNDDAWWINQELRDNLDSEGLVIVNEGEAEGTVLGGNLDTFGLLRGTNYFPDLSGSLIFIEDDDVTTDVSFDRNLQALINQPKFNEVKALVVGRFQKKSKLDSDKLIRILKNKPELQNMPVIINADFGHTEPRLTLPIGAEAKIVCKQGKAEILILKH
ncbi:LD-carboxypeptidase [Patescibacteria group bacterium]|nr:LD-carboxypeptidase [Patescibacteria group bacterium]